MDLMRTGVILMFAGGIIALENSKIGGYIFAIGAICLIVQGSEGTKEACECKSKPSTIEEQEIAADTKYKLVGNQILILDKDDNVIATLPADGKKKFIGSNRK